ncbi:MAG: hypothetical protein FD152_3726 [Xanthobacteraceae bacterium]|nr:MAG: hypothetical protein FD152_3726 [Xanthobacteraceae bacterium]
MNLSPEEAVGQAVAAIVRDRLPAVTYYDYVPADGQLRSPLAALGIVGSQRRHGNRCAKEWAVTFRLHLMSKAAGREEVWRHLQDLRDALDGQSLALAAPYAAETKIRELRAGDDRDRLQAFNHAFIQFELTVSRPLA